MTARIAGHLRELGRARSRRSGGQSRRNIEKIRFRGNWSRAAIWFLISMLFILTVVIPWLVRHPPTEPETPRREPTLRERSHFRPSFFPAASRRIDSRMRLFRVSGRLAV